MTQKTLTKDIKSEIVKNALVKSGIFEKEEQLYKDRADWTEKVRIEAIGGENMDSGVNDIISEIKKLANKIPPALRIDAFPIYESSYIEINLAGISVLAFYNGSLRYSQREYRERVFKITPKVKNVILADNPLVNEFYELEKRHNELENQRRDITNNVEAALAKVRTVKRLLTEWPEAEELLPKSTAKAAPVPAVRRDALNEMIGLPTEVVG
ncbi:Nmad5 family putative nucleotide modification protein [Xenorhabdus griffiniae]|uniref:Nmad5 family putative nucleotide modification protein n=1 Tax=Xenorhabdus griffiniae TaxID=351672 RepID=UPI0006492D7C|nr:Nmad5 family putative nucleotide modification protein [Xenorhabdus griffiniae]KLU15571.1 hypothetical protein AAY47_10375 [Xenorhabdus griffiniae]